MRGRVWVIGLMGSYRGGRRSLRLPSPIEIRPSNALYAGEPTLCTCLDEWAATFDAGTFTRFPFRQAPDDRREVWMQGCGHRRFLAWQTGFFWSRGPLFTRVQLYYTYTKLSEAPHREQSGRRPGHDLMLGDISLPAVDAAYRSARETMRLARS